MRVPFGTGRSSAASSRGGSAGPAPPRRPPVTVTFDRRTFLARAGLAGAGALALTLAGARPPAQADETLGPFPHGVASGDPLADRVILWTRVQAPGTAPVEVTWHVFTDLALTRRVTGGRVTTDASRDFTVKVDVTGLSPATTYYYVFEALDGVSIIGRTRTAPAEGVQRLRFGVVSCSNYEAGFFNGYARLAERPDLDAILHLGDYLYEYGAGKYGAAEETGRFHAPESEIVTRTDYRTRHAQYHLDPDLRRLHQLFPWVVVWDDHESANDSWADGAENHDEATQGDWQTRKRISQEVYREWLPIRTDDPARIWRTLPFGDLCDLIMLDTRLERNQEPGGQIFTLPDVTADDPDRRMLSPEQSAWLQGELTGSRDRGTRWRIVGQQVMVMQWAIPGLPGALTGPDSPLPFVRSNGNVFNADAWDGYTAERTRLFDFLRDEGITDNVVLTGDIHTSWAADLTADPYDLLTYDPLTARNTVGVEFVTPSITSDNFDEILGVPESAVAPFELAVQALNPHVRFVDLARHGFLVLDVTREAVQADFFYTPRLEASDAETYGGSFRTRHGEDRVTSASGPLPAAEVGGEVPGGDPAVLPTGTPPTPGGDGPSGDVDGGDGEVDDVVGGTDPRPPAPAVEERVTPVRGPLPVTGGSAGATWGLAAIAAAGVLRLRNRAADPAAGPPTDEASPAS
ncbi:hypothetical protein FTX61_07080 [Nitriliruptoraceae bacterium ZYF776]|nr:hypothetical protein [Profundirhabdus halotolerans]